MIFRIWITIIIVFTFCVTFRMIDKLILEWAGNWDILVKLSVLFLAVMFISYRTK